MSNQQGYRAGMGHYHAGRYAEAISHLRPLTAGTSPIAMLSRFYCGQAHHKLALDLFDAGRFDEAAGHFQAAAKANPVGGNVARFLAVCFVGTERLDLAADQFEKLVVGDPHDTEARIRLALVQAKRGQYIEAVALLREGLRFQPDHADLHYQLGAMLAAMEDMAEAQHAFARAIECDPDHAGAHERLGQCLGLAGCTHEAFECLQRAHALDPNNARIALQITILNRLFASTATPVSVRLARPVKAAEWEPPDLDRLAEAIVAEPDFVEAFLSLPASEVDLEVFGVLASTLERALSRHSEYADLHYHCGQVYRRLGRSAEAIEHIERAIAINPRYAKAMVLLAELYAQTEHCGPAIERLEQAIQLGADDPDVHYMLGRLYQQDDHPDLARRAFQDALGLDRDHQLARQALDTLVI